MRGKGDLRGILNIRRVVEELGMEPQKSISMISGRLSGSEGLTSYLLII